MCTKPFHEKTDDDGQEKEDNYTFKTQRLDSMIKGKGSKDNEIEHEEKNGSLNRNRKISR